MPVSASYSLQTSELAGKHFPANICPRNSTLSSKVSTEVRPLFQTLRWQPLARGKTSLTGHIPLPRVSLCTCLINCVSVPNRCRGAPQTEVGRVAKTTSPSWFCTLRSIHLGYEEISLWKSTTQLSRHNSHFEINKILFLLQKYCRTR